MRLINADDFISRFDHVPLVQEAIKKAMDCMPTIEERNKGSWTDDNACPFCGFQPWHERDIHTLSFCPNCGAVMRGEKDETN